MPGGGGFPLPRKRECACKGADLRGWRIGGREDGALLNLRDADFEGARLDGAVLERVDLGGACLRGAHLERAELLDSRARGVDLRSSSLAGCRFRGAGLEESMFASADLYRTRFLRCRLEGAEGVGEDHPGALLVACEPEVECPSSGALRGR